MLLHQSRGSLQAALPCNSIVFISQDRPRGPAAIPCTSIGCPPSPGSTGRGWGCLGRGMGWLGGGFGLGAVGRRGCWYLVTGLRSLEGKRKGEKKNKKTTNPNHSPLLEMLSGKEGRRQEQLKFSPSIIEACKRIRVEGEKKKKGLSLLPPAPKTGLNRAAFHGNKGMWGEWAFA